MQQRFESSDIGRALISGFLLVTLLVMFTLNLPSRWVGPPRLVETLRPLTDAYVAVSGLEQIWNMFAPNPRRDVLDWYARVHFADGSTAIWRIPTGDPFLASFRTNRWGKWMEAVWRDNFRYVFFEATALYVARQVASDGRRPVAVIFVRRAYTLREPGSNAGPAPWQESAYYAVRLHPRAAAVR